MYIFKNIKFSVYALSHEVHHARVGDPRALVPFQEGSPTVCEHHLLKLFNRA